MKEEATIVLSHKLSVSDQPHTPSVKELLLKELKDNLHVVENMIGGYYYSSRGKVHNGRFDENVVVFNSERAGSFPFEFSINYNLGCQDLTYDEGNKMVISFEIDADGRTMRLVGEEVQEREPDAY